MTSMDGRRSQSGEALVEFALILPILLVLSLGMLDFGRAFHAKSLVDQAAREGCRVAIVTKPLDQALIVERVEKVLEAGNMKPNSVTSNLDANRLVEVEVEITFKFITPGVFSLIGAKFDNTMELVGRAVMRSETGN
ncbi:MAG TPA: TadE family protein [Candidatus Dormibacteraeota bacterium]|nr:TadE family protein [Candidatus Dormibacteraeota bacterium]